MADGALMDESTYPKSATTLNQWEKCSQLVHTFLMVIFHLESSNVSARIINILCSHT